MSTVSYENGVAHRREGGKSLKNSDCIGPLGHLTLDVNAAYTQNHRYTPDSRGIYIRNTSSTNEAM